MKKYSRGFLTAVCFVAVSAGCASVPPAQQNPEMAHKFSKMRRILMIPAEMNIREVDVLGDSKALHEQNKAASNALTRILMTSLTGLGYEVEIFNPSGEVMARDRDLAASFNLLKIKFGSYSNHIEEQYLKTRTIDISGISMGAEVNPFADLYHVDALIFIEAAGFIKSERMVKRDISKAVLNQATAIPFGSGGTTAVDILDTTYNAGHLHVGLIDADTGKFLWHGFNDQGTKYDVSDIQSLTEMVEYTLKKFPPSQRGAGEAVTTSGRMEKINGRKTMVV